MRGGVVAKSGHISCHTLIISCCSICSLSYFCHIVQANIEFKSAPYEYFSMNEFVSQHSKYLTFVLVSFLPGYNLKLDRGQNHNGESN